MGSRRSLDGCRALVVIAALALGACGDDDEPKSADTTTETSDPRSTTSSTTSTTVATSLPLFPEPRPTLEHGGRTWAVVLGGSSESDSLELVHAQEAAADAGYETGPTDCDVGAAEALGLPGDQHSYTVSVYFMSQRDAEQALVAFEARSVDGVIAEVETFCGD